MRYISLETLKILLADDFMRACCLDGKTPVQFHHNLIYGGSQVDDAWTILPLCKTCHDNEKRRDVKEKLDWIMLSRGTNEQLLKYSKVVNLIYRRDQLVAKFGTFPGK
jgi:hypothetical protein